MTQKKITNLAASVHARLLKQADAIKRPYNDLAQRYFMERILYRLSRSPHASRFCLKGALMFVAWNAPVFRPTKDIDLLGHVQSSIESLVNIFRDVCRQSVEADGLTFDADGVRGELIAEDAEYGGIRIIVPGHFYQNAKVSIQIDIGFGDKIIPGPMPVTLKPILDFPAPQMNGYSRESAISEKFDAMVKRGEMNSRMKDYYDIWFLSQNFVFDGAILAQAIAATRQARGRGVENAAAALSASFAEKNRKAWQSFVRRGALLDVPGDFLSVLSTVRAFLEPPANAAVSGAVFDSQWMPKGPWI